MTLNFFSDKNSMDDIARVICAALGVVPILVSAFFGHIGILLATTFSTIATILNSVSAPPDQPVFVTVDCASGVLLVVICSFSLQIWRTVLGAVRLLWVVILVTSSSSYAIIRAFAPDVGIIPNDLTILAIAACLTLLILFAAVNRCAKPQYKERDKRFVVVELLFVLGALALRFSEDITRTTTVDDIGECLWYISCWAATVGTVYLLETPMIDA